MHEIDVAVATDVDVAEDGPERGGLERYADDACEPAVGIVQPPAGHDEPFAVAAVDARLAYIELRGMRAMPVEVVAIRKIPRGRRMQVGVVRQHAACAEHEQRTGTGQLGDLLLKQGMRVPT